MTVKEFYEKYGDVELTEEQEKHIKEYLRIKNKKWKPKKGEKFFYTDGYGEVDYGIYDEDDADTAYATLTNNYFKTKEEAEFKLEQIKVYNELKNFADENNEEIDWENVNKRKYFIRLNRCQNILIFDGYFNFQDIGQIYFSSEKLAQQAIDKVGADRINKYLFGVE